MFFTKKQKEKYEQEIANLRHEVAELSQIIKTQELLRLRAENERLKEKETLISKVKFRLKDVAYLDEEDCVLVKYEIPYAKVYFEANGQVKKNDFFYAINRLQLLSFDDMKKIQKVIDNVKKLKEK